MNQALTETEEQYLQGKMNAAERTVFEAGLSGNPTDAERLAQLREQRALLEAVEEEGWMQKFDTWERESLNDTIPVLPSAHRKSVFQKRWLVPLGILLVVAGGIKYMGLGYFMPDHTNPNPDPPIQDHTPPLPNGPNAPTGPPPKAPDPIRPSDTKKPIKQPSAIEKQVLAFAATSGLESTEQLLRMKFKGQTRAYNNLSPNDTLYNALVSYQRGQHDSTLLWLGSSPRSADGLLLRGIACLKAGRLTDAETALQRLIQLPVNSYIQEAHWYMLLCYRAQLPDRKSDYDRQKIIFETIAGSYFKNKLKLLEQSIPQ